jgi:hypothetical protein
MTLATVLVLIGTILASIVAVLDLLKHPTPQWVLAVAAALIGLGVLLGAGKLTVH